MFVKEYIASYLISYFKKSTFIILWLYNEFAAIFNIIHYYGTPLLKCCYAMTAANVQLYER